MKYLVLAAIFAISKAACPNQCSGHGTCGANDKCTCFARWVASDCSARQCPYGLSWVAAADNTDSPAGGALDGNHDYTECSSRGLCNADSGECECFDGYTGRACRRTTCPNDCSGHGRCLYNNQVSSNYDAHVEFGSQYWDGAKTRQCECDRGYEGVDCSVRICPHGDDPLTTCKEGSSGTPGTSKNDVQTISFTINGDGFFTLTFTDKFNGVYETKPIAADAATGVVDADVEAALEELPNFAVPDVTVTSANSGTDISVEFVHAGNSGQQNKLVVSATGDDHNIAAAQPRFASFTGSASVDHTQTIDTNDQYKESVSCSNRGNCDGDTGLCSCFEGYTGEACHLQTVMF